MKTLPMSLKKGDLLSPRSRHCRALKARKHLAYSENYKLWYESRHPHPSETGRLFGGDKHPSPTTTLSWCHVNFLPACTSIFVSAPLNLGPGTEC